MKKIDRIRNHEAARIMLIKAADLVTEAERKMYGSSAMPTIEKKSQRAIENIDGMLALVITEQDADE